MTSITDLVLRFSEHERPIGTVLSDDVLLSQAVAATLKYSGYGVILSRAEQIDVFTLLSIPNLPLDETCELTDSEWAIIRPLFMLYVERENAVYLEASRGMGLDVYGRSVAEITGDITNFEMELPKLAFCRGIVTV
jgi:hypothetical protein